MTKNNTKILKFHNTDSKLVELMCNVHEKVTLAFYDLQKKEISTVWFTVIHMCVHIISKLSKKKKKIQLYKKHDVFSFKVKLEPTLFLQGYL